MSDHPLAPHVVPSDEVSSRIALRHLIHAYGHGVDRRDWDLLRTLYHDDAIDDHTPYYSGLATGYIDWLADMMAQWTATMHTAFTQLVVIDGDHAEGEVTARAWHLTNDRTRQFIAWGRYADCYERRHGVWRFAHRSFILDHVEDLPNLPGSTFGSEGVEIGQPGPTDPIYTRLSMFRSSKGVS